MVKLGTKCSSTSFLQFEKVFVPEPHIHGSNMKIQVFEGNGGIAETWRELDNLVDRPKHNRSFDEDAPYNSGLFTGK